MNPILFRQGICDPHIHIFEGKAYLYATKDNLEKGDSFFSMTEWQIWSSENLIDWTLERRLFPEDFYCGATDQCWATDAAFMNGKYYWYFSRGSEEVGVGVSDSPAGPFRDALGRALLDANTPPRNIPKWDPCCFIDDDGTPYLISGCTREPAPNNQYLICRLNRDMVSLAEGLRGIEYIGNPCDEDKVTIHKRNGRYYLSHASYYAISDTVYGPYIHRGNFAANNDHGCFFTFHNQEYNASGGLDNPSWTYRSSFLYYVHYKDNGDIVVDKQIGQYGVGQYDACWDRIECEWYFDANGIVKRENPNGGFEIGDIHAGDYLFYPNVNHVEKNSPLCVWASCQNTNGGVIVIRNGKQGPILGRIHVSPTGSWSQYKKFSTVLNNQPGTLDLYFEFCGDRAELLRLDAFSLSDENWYRHCSESYLGATTGGVHTVSDSRASCHRKAGGFYKDGDSLTVFCDGSVNATLLIHYWNEGPDGILTLYINNKRFQKVDFSQTGAQGATLCFTSILSDGINQITVCKEASDKAEMVYIDSFVTKRIRSIQRSYPVGNADYFPRGNGCWDGLPQTECDPFAFSGRMLNYLVKDGCGFVLENIEGASGYAILEFRYSTTCTSKFLLLINGQSVRTLCFPATGSDTMECAKTITVAAFLENGKNKIMLKKLGAEGKLSMDAITVSPL